MWIFATLEYVQQFVPYENFEEYLLKFTSDAGINISCDLLVFQNFFRRFPLLQFNKDSFELDFA